MNIQQLEYALALEQTGSFSRAARRAGLSQSAVSQQISKLETELGFPLFDRQTKPIQPTSLGQRFLQRARIVLLEVQQLHDFARQLESEAEGHLKVGIIPTLAPYLLPFFIQDLQRQHPSIRLEVQEMMTKDIIRALMDGEINAGIISTPIATEHPFHFEPLFFERFFLYVSYKHDLFKKRQIALDEVEEKDIWLLNEGNCFSDQVNNMCHLRPPHPRKAQLEYRSNSIDALRRVVEHKGGLTFLPELATLSVAQEQEDMIKSISGPQRAREISLVCLPNDPQRSRIDQLVEVIKRNLPKSILEESGKILVKTNVEI